MDLNPINLTQICRTCKCVSPHMRSLFEGYKDPCQSPRIDEMLIACASVQVEREDGLPSQICEICVEQLRNAFVFKLQCQEIDASLREYLKHINEDNKIKKEVQTPDCMESNSFNATSNGQQSNSKENTLYESITLVAPKVETECTQLMDDNQSLTCQECAKIFTTLEELRCHKSLQNDGTYKCKQHDKEYTRLNQPQQHEQIADTRQELHVCRICSKILSTAHHLKSHLATHLKKKPFSCKTCVRGFTRVEQLNSHMTKCKGDTVYRCDTCNKTFKREYNLEVHKKMHNTQQPKFLAIENLDIGSDLYRRSDQEEEVSFSDVDDSVDPLVDFTDTVNEENAMETDNDSIDDESNVSGLSAAVTIDNNDSNMDPEISEVKVEIMISGPSDNEEDNDGEAGDDSGHSTVSEYLPKKSSNMEYKKDGYHKKRSRKGSCPRKCIKKGSKEEEEGQLDGHTTEKHKGLKAHKCPECDMEFSKTVELKRHRRSHAAKTFQCTVCTKSFTTQRCLNLHEKSHSRQKNLECDICQRMFTRTNNLAKHKATHMNDNTIERGKYECPICNKSFTMEKYRDIHVNGHNATEPSKQIVCPECGQIFVRKDYLDIHMRRHRGEKPFKCQYCGNGFPRSSDLRVHERYHTGETTHLCTICGKGFGRGYSLRVHMRTHTGEKPYKCTYCDAAFAQGNDLKTHVRKHTGERLQCNLCTESFGWRFLLTQHKRSVHGLQIATGTRRLKPILNQDRTEELSSVGTPLLKPDVQEKNPNDSHADGNDASEH